MGGKGVNDLEVKNSSLLGKWFYKLLTEDGVWQTIVRRKYIGEKAFSQILWKPGDSHFWAGQMEKKKFSSGMVLSILRIDRRYGYGRISG
jgi:hypothetical protein